MYAILFKEISVDLDGHYRHFILVFLQASTNGHGDHTRNRQTGTHLHVWRFVLHAVIEYLRIHRTINRYKMLIGGILLPIALSGTIELLQAYCTEHRSGDWLDFAANTLGVLLAALVGYYILRPLMWKKT